ncbi:hypothetical protein [Pseudomonas sp. A-R-19]|uniref:hypothetical protein n=1 Tax=Pseudomonas sp. A-R-19 TaxID=2832403 RepID=UPI001CBD3BCA|nr:hypothetical protein [Pseudomonas sp. A-R-19]
MKFTPLAAVALLAMPITGFADSLYLSCKQLSSPKFNYESAYKKTPKNARDQFLVDAVEQGIIGKFMIPPSTWEINLSDEIIVSPEQSHKVMAITTVSNSKIEGASNFGSSFNLNRINATLEYSSYLSEESITTWKKAHGGVLPPVLTYKYVCESSGRPAI